MQVLVLSDFHRMAIEERAKPRLDGPEDVLLTISYTGICGSDIHGYTGENGRRRPGQIMGHEAVARIADLGASAAASGLHLGQVVTFNPLLSCGECESCQRGAQQHCPSRVVIGVAPHVVSAFAEQMVVPAKNLVPLADGVPETYGALVEPLAVALHAARRSLMQEGDSVFVAGGGPIGQSVVLAALRLGASHVVISDISTDRRALCERLGARSVDPSSGQVAEQVIEILGQPADVAIDAVGISPTMTDALQATKLGGTISLVGMGSPELSVPAYKVSTEERTVIGSFTYDKDTFEDAAAWVGEGDPAFDELISELVAFSEAPAAFERLATVADVPGKILVRVSERG